MSEGGPGHSGAQQRGLCASARPSQAQRRVEDEGGGRRNEEEEEEGGSQERALAWDPRLALIS